MAVSSSSYYGFLSMLEVVTGAGVAPSGSIGVDSSRGWGALRSEPRCSSSHLSISSERPANGRFPSKSIILSLEQISAVTCRTIAKELTSLTPLSPTDVSQPFPRHFCVSSTGLLSAGAQSCLVVLSGIPLRAIQRNTNVIIFRTSESSISAVFSLNGFVQFSFVP